MMSKVIVIVAVIVLMAVGNAGAQDNLPMAERVGKLVGQLSDDNINVREKATEELIAMGEPAKGALSAAARSSDPEVKHRADLILRVVEIKGKINFSEKLLAWYPEIYRELASNPTVRGRYDVFLKLTAFDSEKHERAVEVENSDIGEVVKLLATGGYEGLSAEEKVCIAKVCRGIYRYWDANEVEHSTASSAWIITGVAGEIAPLLKDQDTGVRGSAAEALGQMQAKEYGKDIIPLLKDQDANVRVSAAEALGQIQAKEYAKDIVPLLKDQDTGVRGSAVEALGQMQAKEYAKDIVPLLKDQNGWVRWNAAGALDELKAKEYAKDILPLLKDSDPFVRRRAARALGEMEATEYAKDIVPLLKDQDGWVRRNAVNVLGKMGAKEYAKDIVPLLKDQSGDVRESAEKALKELGVSEEEIGKAKERGVTR